MKRKISTIALCVFFTLFLSLFISCSEDTDRFRIEILDEEALGLLDPEKEIGVIGNGFTWTEGPLWVEEGQYLLFSDIPNNKVFKIDAKDNTSEYLFPSGYMGEGFTGEEPGSNGLLLSPEGELVLMQHGERRVAKMTGSLDRPVPQFEVLADRFEGKRFNSPNDGVFDPYGNLYFTDPPYGLPKRMEDANKELTFQGVYCLKGNGGLVLVDTLTRPNGIALSPDHKKLYVAVSDPDHAVWYQYDITAPGEVRNRVLFYDTTHLVGKEGQQGLPDGMKMHSKGYLFASGPGGIWIFNLGGKAIARIHTGEATSNCAFSTDERTLFITADDNVLKLDLK